MNAQLLLRIRGSYRRSVTQLECSNQSFASRQPSRRRNTNSCKWELLFSTRYFRPLMTIYVWFGDYFWLLHKADYRNLRESLMESVGMIGTSLRDKLSWFQAYPLRPEIVVDRDIFRPCTSIIALYVRYLSLLKCCHSHSNWWRPQFLDKFLMITTYEKKFKVIIRVRGTLVA